MIKYDLSPLNHSQLKHILSQLTNVFFSALAEIRGVALGSRCIGKGFEI